jgi:type IV pilus assembly PilO-like protein
VTAKLLNSPKLALAVANPKKSEAKELDAKIATLNQEIDQRRAALASPKADVHIRTGDLFRLAKAMPDGTDMPGVMLDVGRLAQQNKIVFRSLTPSPALPQPSGYQVVPIQLVVEGRFSDLSRYLGELRRLVGVQHKQLDSRGRLFSIDAVSIDKAQEKDFPFVQATLTMNAFSFTGPPPAPPATPGTEQSETPSPSSEATVAAGATP